MGAQGWGEPELLRRVAELAEARLGVGVDVLSVERISLSFGGVQALADVSFAVREGSITAVIGPNGAGKTSLLNCVAGFYRPQRGRIGFAGRDITRVPADRRPALGLARTFQNIALFEGMTVLDNVKLGAHAHLKTNVFQARAYSPAARRVMSMTLRLIATAP